MQNSGIRCRASAYKRVRSRVPLVLRQLHDLRERRGGLAASATQRRDQTKERRLRMSIERRRSICLSCRQPAQNTSSQKNFAASATPIVGEQPGLCRRSINLFHSVMT